MAVVHRVVAIACLVVVAAIGPAVVDRVVEEDIPAAVGIAYMVVGSIDLAVVEVAAYFLLECSLYDRGGIKIL